MSYFVYILRCADESLYTGITTDLQRRVGEHNGKTPGGAKYTNNRRPVRLVYQESCKNRSDASQKEALIKKLRKEEKEQLVSNN